MSRAVAKPRTLGADELFRPTSRPSGDSAEGGKEPKPASVTGRVRHDEKITVYFSSEELICLEDARLELRRNHKIAVDRGRIVRTAVALALADLAEQGTESALYRHLEK